MKICNVKKGDILKIGNEFPKDKEIFFDDKGRWASGLFTPSQLQGISKCIPLCNGIPYDSRTHCCRWVDGRHQLFERRKVVAYYVRAKGRWNISWLLEHAWIESDFIPNKSAGLYPRRLSPRLISIPGIVKTYSYAMAPYILCENPNMTANEAITESKRIMEGHKGELFLLELSFIGWHLLVFLPIFATPFLTGLGMIFIILWLLFSFAWAMCIGFYVETYKQATFAAFYREITKPKI